MQNFSGLFNDSLICLRKIDVEEKNPIAKTWCRLGTVVIE
jgi:hypothetical protein